MICNSFYRSGTWGDEIKIIATGGGANGDQFGCLVSISGDYAIVGVEREDRAGTNRGAVYIFRRTGLNTWNTGTKIIASDGADDDVFGWTVSISGDQAIIGDPYKDGSGTNRVASYIFYR